MKTTQDQVLRSVAKIFDARIANRLADILADKLIPADVVEAPPLGFEVWVPTSTLIAPKRYSRRLDLLRKS